MNPDISIEGQVKKVASYWSSVAKEEIKVEKISGAFYGYGSELATLRLYKYYRGVKISQGYSENKKSWYICQETNL